MSTEYEVIVLFPGYSQIENNEMLANCSCTLVKGPQNIVIDTMTAWDGEKIIEALQKQDLKAEDISYVICTHGHSDHIGCNYLFQNAIHIVGHSISFKTKYFDHDFRNGKEYIIDDNIRVIPTPGHTLQDVTVMVKCSKGKVAITGDLFEKEMDLENDDIWIEAGSDDEKLQRINRDNILKLADFIVPGHGAMFAVPKFYKK